jgi:hypothetical protein
MAPRSRNSVTVLLWLAPPNRSAYPQGRALDDLARPLVVARKLGANGDVGAAVEQ